MQHPPKEICQWLGKHFPNLRIAYGGKEDKYFLLQLYPQHKYGTYKQPRILKCPWYVVETEAQFGGTELSRIERGPIYGTSGKIEFPPAGQIPVIECEISTATVFSESDYKTLQFGDKAVIDKKRRDALWEEGKRAQSDMQARATDDVDFIRYQSQRHGYRAGGELTMNDRIQAGKESEISLAKTDLTDHFIKHGTPQ